MQMTVLAISPHVYLPYLMIWLLLLLLLHICSLFCLPLWLCAEVHALCFNSRASQLWITAHIYGIIVSATYERVHQCPL